MTDPKKKEKISLEEYLALQKKNQKPAFKLPASVKIALATPAIIIFCFGLFYLPFMIFSIATSKPAPEKTEKTVSYHDIKKDTASSESSNQ